MGKRSDFKRRPMDFYATPEEAVLPLLPWLSPNVKYCEPCAGEGDLIQHLDKHGHQCVAAFDLDVDTPYEMMDTQYIHKTHICGADMIITNPPWSRDILHPMIMAFKDIAPTWLLFDADWMHTKQSIPYMRHCQMIVSVGRVKWIEGSKNTGKDNCAWYLFGENRVTGATFIGRR